MGIKGLLVALKSIQKNTHLRKYAGQTIGVDAYGWLHRGAAACAMDLALGKPTDRYIAFVMNKVRMLRDFGIIPYLVFDGDALPSKQETNDQRRVTRSEAKALGLELHRAGKTVQAFQEFQKGVEITPLMARNLIEELKQAKVRYLVAPYEADAQLAYLEKMGIIDAIMAEDSDLLVYGAKKLITKLEQYGDCVEIVRSDFPLCRDLSLVDWSDAMFRRMAILSGCDYLPNIPRMGLKTSHMFVKKYKMPEKILQMVQYEGKFVVPPEYLTKFRDAELTFLHHRVFCPIERRMVHLNDLDHSTKAEDMPHLGSYVEPEIAIGVACGDLHPRSKEMIDLRLFEPGRRVEPPSIMRRQTMASLAELKPSKPITTFFKRRPLAELDPNSLTPSPSQQRLLRAATNSTWEPRLISSAPQHGSSFTAPASGTDSVSFALDRRVFCSDAAKKSTFQPQKRQRLCSEAGEVSPSKEVKQSPFFARPADEPSSLALKMGRTRKARRSGFAVWSDDLTDEQPHSVGNVEQVASPRKKDASTSMGRKSEAASSETDQAIPPSSQNVPESPSQPEERNSSASGSDETSVQATALTPEDEGFVDLLDFHVQKLNESRFQSQLKTFISQTPSKRQAALQSLEGSPKSNKDATKRTFSAQSVELQAAALASLDTAHDRCSPRKSDAEPVADRLSGLAATFSHQSANVQSAVFKSLNVLQSPDKQIEPERAVQLGKDSTKGVTTASGSPHLKEASEVTAAISLSPAGIRQPQTGSEDALVPNSEDEAEIDEPAANGFGCMVNLQAFVFKA